MKTSSETTWRAFGSMFGPFAIANFMLFAMLILLGVFQPNLDEPDTYWVIVVMGALVLVSFGFVVKGGLRYRNLQTSAKRDRERIAAGLPVDDEDDT